MMSTESCSVQGQQTGFSLLADEQRGKPSVKRRKIKMYTCPVFTSARADEDQPHRFCLQQKSGSVLRSADQPQTTADESARLKACGQAYERGRRRRPVQQAGRTDLPGDEMKQLQPQEMMDENTAVETTGCQHQRWANTQTRSDESSCVQAKMYLSEETTGEASTQCADCRKGYPSARTEGLATCLQISSSHVTNSKIQLRF